MELRIQLISQLRLILILTSTYRLGDKYSPKIHRRTGQGPRGLDPHCTDWRGLDVR